MRRIFIFLRPFGIALAVFIFLNLALAIRRPTLSATSIWLYLKIREPLLSAIAGVLGLALLVPHASAARAANRLLVGGVLVGFLALSGANIMNFYIATRNGRVASAFPLPFSLVIAAILASEAARVIWWIPVTPRLPLLARRFIASASVVLAFFVLILAHIVTFGLTDYAPAVETADAAVILGAKVYPDGTLSAALEDRVLTGLRLFKEGRVRFLILSGGVEPGGLSEPRAMAHALENYVPQSCLILDEGGANTLCSAQNSRRIAEEMGFSRKLLVVSQYYHNARVKMVFEREGTVCYTVPAQYRRLAREPYFLLREVIAFPIYYLCYL
jgi:vancomycin permeability regulator SanA